MKTEKTGHIEGLNETKMRFLFEQITIYYDSIQVSIESIHKKSLALAAALTAIDTSLIAYFVKDLARGLALPVFSMVIMFSVGICFLLYVFKPHKHIGKGNLPEVLLLENLISCNIEDIIYSEAYNYSERIDSNLKILNRMAKAYSIAITISFLTPIIGCLLFFGIRAAS